MKSFSNKYIFVYSIVMVCIVAVVLSTVAMLLQPMQERNVEIEKMQSILASVNIHATAQDAEQLYAEKITEYLVNTDGTLAPVRAVISDDANLLYLCRNNGDTSYIIPLKGNGLWGPIWGYLALKNDLRTIVGATFNHKGETPGLGAEINTKKFSEQFIGKEIFDEQGNFTSVKVVKGGVANSSIDPKHGVDAISGGTITSNGVSAMLDNSLQKYEAFLKKGAAVAAVSTIDTVVPQEKIEIVAQETAKVSTVVKNEEPVNTANAESTSKKEAIVEELPMESAH